MTYRILSLDGGGTWALIEVNALIALYDGDTTKLGHDILKDFDLVAANSGGSIVLGALLANFTLGKIRDFFQNEETRKSVFSKTHSLLDRAVHDVTGLGPKYSASNKLNALRLVLGQTGDTPLTSVVNNLPRSASSEPLHLLIVAFDYDRNRATFFRSSSSGGASWGTGDPSNVTLAQAIHASTNAPVNYFDAPATFPDRPGRYWDGALTGCNNPVLAAVTEAISRGQHPMDIVALSLGTASVALPLQRPDDPPSPFLQPLVKQDLATDLHKLATSVLDDPPDAATYLSHVMTGSGIALNKPPADSRIVRMSPLISPVKLSASSPWSAPGPMTDAQFTFLKNLDMDAVEQDQVAAISSYTELWLHDLALNQPIRMDGDTHTTELGQDKFSAAISAWKAIR